MLRTELLLALALVATPAAAEMVRTSVAEPVKIVAAGAPPRTRLRLAEPKNELEIGVKVDLRADDQLLALHFNLVAKPGAGRVWTVVAHCEEPAITARGSFRSTDSGRLDEFHWKMPDESQSSDQHDRSGVWHALDMIAEVLMAAGDMLPDGEVGTGAQWASSSELRKSDGGFTVSMISATRWEALAVRDHDVLLKLVAPMRFVAPAGAPIELAGSLAGAVRIDPAVALPVQYRIDMRAKGTIEGHATDMRAVIQLQVEKR